MPARPGEALFETEGRLGALAWRLPLFFSALVANLVADRHGFHVGLALCGALLLAGSGKRGRRALPGLTLVVVIAAAALALAGLTGAPSVTTPALRWIAGTAWALWFAAGLDWPSVRGCLRRLRAPEPAVEVLELAISQAALLGEYLRRRREAARVRGAPRRGLPALRTAASVIAGAIVRALERAEIMDGVRDMRLAARQREPSTARLVAENLVVRSDDGSVRLKGVSFAVEPGTWIAVGGRSGAGKSTLLRALAGLERPSAGRFGFVGADGELKMEPGAYLVLQEPEEQIFCSTAREDLLWALRNRGVPDAAAQTRALEVLSALGIAHVADRPVFRMSFGERKRLAMATALVAEPRVIICDEPTMGLDPITAEELATCLAAAVKGTDVAVMWATHDLHQLPPEVSRLVLLRDGELVFDGPVSEGLTPTWLRQAGLLK